MSDAPVKCSCSCGWSHPAAPLSMVGDIRATHDCRSAPDAPIFKIEMLCKKCHGTGSPIGSIRFDERCDCEAGKKRVLYLCHGLYGCGTGCCGFRLCEDDEGDRVVGKFVFHHVDDESPQEFAENHWADANGAEVRKGKWFDCHRWDEP